MNNHSISFIVYNLIEAVAAEIKKIYSFTFLEFWYVQTMCNCLLHFVTHSVHSSFYFHTLYLLHFLFTIGFQLCAIYHIAHHFQWILICICLFLPFYSELRHVFVQLISILSSQYDLTHFRTCSVYLNFSWIFHSLSSAAKHWNRVLSLSIRHFQISKFLLLRWLAMFSWGVNFYFFSLPECSIFLLYLASSKIQQCEIKNSHTLFSSIR